MFDGLSCRPPTAMRTAAIIVYASAGLATALQQYRNLMWAIWGAPTYTIQYVGLLGAVVIFLSGLVAIFSEVWAHRVALIGALVAWAFYGGALIQSVPELARRGGLPIGEVILFLGPSVLLMAATVLAGFGILRGRPRLAGSVA